MRHLIVRWVFYMVLCQKQKSISAIWHSSWALAKATNLGHNKEKSHDLQPTSKQKPLKDICTIYSFLRMHQHPSFALKCSSSTSHKEKISQPPKALFAPQWSSLYEWVKFQITQLKRSEIYLNKGCYLLIV